MTTHATKAKPRSDRDCGHCEGRGWVQFKGWPKVCAGCDGTGKQALVSIPVIPTFMARAKTDSSTFHYFDPDRIDA